MKKLSAIAILLCMLMSVCFTCLPTYAAEDKYADAKEGDLLYTVNFAGDEYYEPKITYGSPDIVVDPLDPGKVTISTSVDKSKSRWGAEITCLPLTETTAYTMYLTVTRDTKDSALGVFVDDQYGIYGYSYNQRLLFGTSTLTGHNTITYADQNIALDSNLKTNGGIYPSVQQLALEFNGQRCTMKAYIKDNGGNWVLIDETIDTEIIIFYTENVGLFLYTYWENQPVTVSDVNIYKGMLISGEKLVEIEETTAKETTAPASVDTTTASQDTTTAAKDTTTAAPKDTTTAAPKDTTTAGKSEKSGCGSALALGLMACVIPAAVVLCRKNKHRK